MQRVSDLLGKDSMIIENLSKNLYRACNFKSNLT